MKHNKQHPIGFENESGLSEDLVVSLRSLVEEERTSSMMSMPAERVMRAVSAAHAAGHRVESWFDRELLSWFKPVFVAGALAILVLAAFNFELSRQNDFNQSTTEMVLGLQPVTVASAYDLSFDGH